jgi:hypothetical protein
MFDTLNADSSCWSNNQAFARWNCDRQSARPPPGAYADLTAVTPQYKQTCGCKNRARHAPVSLWGPGFRPVPVFTGQLRLGGQPFPC